MQDIVFVKFDTEKTRLQEPILFCKYSLNGTVLFRQNKQISFSHVHAFEMTFHYKFSAYFFPHL